MVIRMFSMDEAGKISSLTELQIDPIALMVMAESREACAGERGRHWTAGAVPFYAQELVAAQRAGLGSAALETQAVNAAMAAWLHDSIFDGMTAEQFVCSDLVFTALPGGVVRCDRLPVAK